MATDVHERLASFRERRARAPLAPDSRGTVAHGTAPPARRIEPAGAAWAGVPGTVSLIFHEGLLVDIRVERSLPRPQGAPRAPLDTLSGGWRWPVPAAGAAAAGGDGDGTGPGDAAVWFDLETTGLGGGAGVRAFLAGMLRDAGDGLRLVQHLLPDLDREDGFLRELAEDLAGTGWITYNGRTFDLPLLADRHVMNRLPPPPRPPDLDLLPAARTVWRDRLPAVSLAALAREVLALGDPADPGGAAMPEMYLAYLASGDPLWLVDALAHNGHDLVALYALTHVLASAIADPPRAWPAADHLGLARLAARWHLPAEPALEAALAVASSPRERARALAARAAHEKRRGRFEAAAQHWEAAVAVGEIPSSRDLLELAMHYEHRARDLGRALAVTERALRLCRLLGSPGGDADLAAWERRRHRLVRRMARSRPD